MMYTPTKHTYYQQYGVVTYTVDSREKGQRRVEKASHRTSRMGRHEIGLSTTMPGKLCYVICEGGPPISSS